MPTHPTNRLKEMNLRAAIGSSRATEETDLKPQGMAFIIFVTARDRDRSRKRPPRRNGRLLVVKGLAENRRHFAGLFLSGMCAAIAYAIHERAHSRRDTGAILEPGRPS
jgi:hypothetical protein